MGGLPVWRVQESSGHFCWAGQAAASLPRVREAGVICPFDSCAHGTALSPGLLWAPHPTGFANRTLQVPYKCQVD